MFTATFFTALTRTLLDSCIQGLVIWLLTKALILLLPSTSAAARYRLMYFSMTLLFAGFITTLIWHIGQLTVPAGMTIYSSGLTGRVPVLSLQTYHLSRLQTLSQLETLPFNYSKLIALLYFAGILVNSLRLIAGYAQLKRLTRNLNEQANIFWDGRVKELCQKLGIPRKVTICFKTLAEIPFTSGYFKPIVFFPLAAINHLTVDQVEAIILHELAHIKRNDYLFNLIQQVIKSFLFFNPFVWLLDRDITREREYCCDDQVIASAGNAGEYARALLVLEEQRKSIPAFAMAASGSSKYPLLTRIKRMIMKSPDASPVQKLAILTATIAVCLSVAWTIPETGVKRAVTLLKNKNFIGKTAGSQGKNSIRIYTVNDTTKPKKPKYKVVIEDENGITKEYPSDRIPDNVRKELIENMISGSANTSHPDSSGRMALQKQLEMMHSANEWQRSKESLTNQMLNEITGSELKESLEKLLKTAENLRLKKFQEELLYQLKNDEWKKVMEALAKQYSGASVQQEDVRQPIQKEIQNMLAISKQAGWDSKDRYAPLILVNGKPYASSGSKGWGYNDMDVDIKDIDNITVLKNESAVKAWGDAGKNGVLLITTKNLGEGNSTKIIGGASLSQPLIVLDGKPVKADVKGFNFGSATEEEYGGLLNINPSDIKDITVLKDEASTKIWGEAAKNGVLLITTKSGAIKKP